MYEETVAVSGPQIQCVEEFGLHLINAELDISSPDICRWISLKLKET